MAAGEHLLEKARALLDCDKQTRIKSISQERWIGYTQAQVLLKKFEDLLIYPKTHRMPCMLLVSNSNNGKSMLLKRFERNHPAVDNPNGEGIIVPVLYVQAPPKPDPGMLCFSILEKLFAPQRAHDTPAKRLAQVVTVLRHVRLQMLIIDELDFVNSGKVDMQRQFLNTLKYLTTELEIPIIAAGTKDSYVALNTEPSVANRFAPEVLPLWTLGTEALKLLASFERILPLKEPSNLTEIPLATELLAKSEEHIGYLSELLNLAAVDAIESGTEKITLNRLKKLKWIMPSERRKN